jgi:hypothetical protein
MNARDTGRRRDVGQHGVALIVTLLAMVLLSTLGLSLALVSSTEERVASAFRDGAETFYAADALLERVVDDLRQIPDWTVVLDGTVTSSFVDRTVQGWPDGLARSSAEATSFLRCGKPACSPADLDQRTATRPWGANNPRWQLFAHGPLADLVEPPAVVPGPYVAAWVGDDPLDNDGRPDVDGDTTGGPNPGSGAVSVVVHAYGVSRTRRVIEAAVRRTRGQVRVVSWREVR